MILSGQSFAPGSADAPALVLAEPLSFWGGIDVETGRVIDRTHPDLGRSVAGLVLVMRGGRGSSSSSSVLAECLRRGTGPAAVLTVGAIVAHALYGLRCPIVVCSIAGFSSGERIRVRAEKNGTAEITHVIEVGS